MGKSLISSPRTGLVLLAVFAAGMAAATFIEKGYGTDAARRWIYYNPVFFLLMGAMVINFVSISVKNSMFCVKKCGFLLVHLAFIVIMAGAFTSHVVGREGFVHLRNGETTDRMLTMTGKGHSEHKFPFSIELVRFTLKRYPGSDSPSSFESLVRIHDGATTHEQLIAMNRVLDWRGYRFFQSSFDADEQGSVLSVNQDPAGRYITYTGYALLMVGFIACFTSRGSRVRNLMSLLSEKDKSHG